jgi:hypothetical protein
MSAPLILFVGALYVYVAFEQAMRGNTGMAIAWAGYAVANVGLAMAAK